ncbi:MAG: SDR family oxidoreductase, partial [Akkermansiaceae bacterium]|nr:SDR family oxidoreductase [Akkermansiaceae bacterium]
MNQLFLTGGSGGLGRAIIDEFTRPNWKITAPDRFDLDLLKKINPTITPQPVDLLVCAAGLVRDKRILDVSDTDWDEIYAVNYQAAADCSAAFLPIMIEQGGGHILFISSYSAIHYLAALAGVSRL